MSTVQDGITDMTVNISYILGRAANGNQSSYRIQSPQVFRLFNCDGFGFYN